MYKKYDNKLFLKESKNLQEVINKLKRGLRQTEIIKLKQHFFGQKEGLSNYSIEKREIFFSSPTLPNFLIFSKILFISFSSVKNKILIS